MDKGKGKMVEPEKAQKAALFPLLTSGIFKIYDKDLALPAPTVTHPIKKEKKPTEAPPKMARVLS